MGEYTDNQILEMFRNSKTRNLAFNHIINQNQKRVYWHIRKIVISHEDANDITQDTFVKVWNNLDSFKGASKIYTWIYTIATNESINLLKKRKKHYFESLDLVSYRLSEKLFAENYFNGKDIERKLQEAILTLPTKQRIAFNMKYFENMKYDDISEVLGTSVGALKANYHHAKNKIEEFLKEY